MEESCPAGSATLALGWDQISFWEISLYLIWRMIEVTTGHLTMCHLLSHAVQRRRYDQSSSRP